MSTAAFSSSVLRHGARSIRQGGGMGPGMETPIYWNYLAMLCFATILIIVRMRQEAVAREIDSLRRMAHAY